jgi:hypothetical protein
MNLLRTWATPLATGTWIVVAVTGTLMFFELAEDAVKEMHEWFGLGAAAAIALHVVRNGSALWTYFRRSWAMVAAMVAVALGVVGFLGAALLEGGDGRKGGSRAVMARVESSPLAELAPVFDTTPDALIAKLSAAGFLGVSAEASPEDIAEASDRPPPAVLAAIFEP